MLGLMGIIVMGVEAEITISNVVSATKCFGYRILVANRRLITLRHNFKQINIEIKTQITTLLA